jgi:hypothetical protein
MMIGPLRQENFGKFKTSSRTNRALVGRAMGEESERMRTFRMIFTDQNRLNIDAKDRTTKPDFPGFTLR